MRINGMRDWLETEEVGLGGGRIEDKSRERRIGCDIKLKSPFRPKNSRATVPVEEGVIDPVGGKRARRGKVPLGTRRDRHFASGQMIIRLQYDALSFCVKLCPWAPHDPRVKAEAKRQRHGAEIADGEPHGQR